MIPMAPQRALFIGPQTRPAVTDNPGPVNAVMMLFYPQAFQPLTGIDISTLVDAWKPPHEIVDAEWRAMIDALMASSCDATRLRIPKEFLDRRWGRRAACGPAMQATTPTA